ncbi:MAG TPA: DUF58 domain-containing protein [Gemmatimonadales bacterium]|nr:DUF58 domain-containing protein [Gemmatimonadales bacterium]
MVLPSRRWFLVASVLALIAPLAVIWPPAAVGLLVFDALWLIALGIEASRVMRFRLADLSVNRIAPPAFSVGRPLPVSYDWRHPLHSPLKVLVREGISPELEIQGDPTRVLVIPPGDGLRETVMFHPKHRGKGEGGTLSLRMLAPWGLAWRQATKQLSWQPTVYPNLVGASMRSLPTQAQRRREAGFRNVRRLGEGRAFESLKEWVPGEDTRTIDWKATARRGKVMARQYEDERRQQVLIVIDAGRMLTAEVEGEPRLESVVRAALHLAHSAVDHDDNIGLMVFADEVQQFVPPARGRRALRAVLDALASIEGKLVEPNYPAAFAYLAGRNRKRALTVLFTDVIDRTASESLVAQIGTLRPRHLPLAVAMRDPALEKLAVRRPATVGVAYERAAAEDLLQAREEALADMRRRGVLVLDVPPNGASEAVVEQYNRLKRRGVL